MKKNLSKEQKINYAVDRILDEVICFQFNVDNEQYYRMKEDIMTIIEDIDL